MFKNGLDVKRLVQLSWDFTSWCVAFLVSISARFDGNASPNYLRNAVSTGIVAGLLHVVISIFSQFQMGRFVIASFDEIRNIFLNSAIVMLPIYMWTIKEGGTFLPRGVPFIAWLTSIVIMLGGRFLLRATRELLHRNRGMQRVLIYGAGNTGEQLSRQMLADSDTRFIPVGFIDDDPTKQNRRINGVRVLGNSSQILSLVQSRGIANLVVAIANIDRQKLTELDKICSEASIKLSVIPSTAELIDGNVYLKDISDVTYEDILGRNPVQTDEVAIRNFLRGKRILITGAGGSIGSEIARQISKYEPKFFGILDRDESALHDVQLSIEGSGLLESDALILADIRDTEKINQVFRELKPDVVFHAAALKHLTLLERYPAEAYKTNVLGTLNVLNAAQLVGTKVFINISTDKAANPTSVLGRSKLLTEQFTAEAGGNSINDRYMSVRFGNVLGSRGSVLTAFRYQIQKGGPITVTHPDVTRFFMTIPEAVHLVLQAAVIGQNQETLILDMGEPIKIADVANQLIMKSGKDIEIIYTGLRSGEKLNEELISADEIAEVKFHPQISHTRVQPLKFSDSLKDLFR